MASILHQVRPVHPPLVMQRHRSDCGDGKGRIRSHRVRLAYWLHKDHWRRKHRQAGDRTGRRSSVVCDDDLVVTAIGRLHILDGQVGGGCAADIFPIHQVCHGHNVCHPAQHVGHSRGHQVCPDLPLITQRRRPGGGDCKGHFRSHPVRLAFRLQRDRRQDIRHRQLRIGTGHRSGNVHDADRVAATVVRLHVSDDQHIGGRAADGRAIFNDSILHQVRSIQPPLVMQRHRSDGVDEKGRS